MFTPLKNVEDIGRDIVFKPYKSALTLIVCAGI